MIQILTDQHMFASSPGPESMEECSDCLDTEGRKYIRQKQLQTNQLPSHYLQGVFKHSSTKDDSYAEFPPAT